MSAKDIALSAYEQAKAAAHMEKLHEEALQMDRERSNYLHNKAVFEASLPILNKWFPGIEWEWQMEGDYGNDVIVWDASEEEWPPSFKLKVNRFFIDMNEPDAGYKVEIQIGDYRPDNLSGGYNYFSGAVVRSAADIGLYLEKRNA